MRYISINTIIKTGCNVKSSRLIFYTIACYLLLNSANCYASAFLLINSGSGEIYNRFENALSATLKAINPHNTLTVRTLSNVNSNINTLISGKYDAIISTGIEASIAISHVDIHAKIIMAMLPKQSYQKLSASGKIVCDAINCHVILLDQPVSRQLRLLKLALPNRNHVAIISSKNSSELLKQIRRDAKNFGLLINEIKIENEDSLLAALNQNLSNADVLMAIPDSMVYNRNTARAVLLTTFNKRIPLFAYSRSFVLAGATLGIYSTPEEIARHVANVLTRPSNLKKLPQILYPHFFSIDVNRRAADALNINIPEIDTLVQRLKAYEKE